MISIRRAESGVVWEEKRIEKGGLRNVGGKELDLKRERKKRESSGSGEGSKEGWKERSVG